MVADVRVVLDFNAKIYQIFKLSSTGYAGFYEYVGVEGRDSHCPPQQLEEAERGRGWGQLKKRSKSQEASSWAISHSPR